MFAIEIKNNRMKKILCSLMVLVMLVVKAQIPTNGLIANYPMGISNSTGTNTVGTHNDVSGNGYNLSFSNGSGYGQSRQLVANEAAAFTGVSTDKRSYSYASNTTAFEQNGDFTISAWVRLGTPISNEYSNIVQIGNNDIFLRFRLTASADFIQGGYRTGASTFSVLSPSIVRANYTNQWRHIVMRRTGTQLEILVDNTQINANTFLTTQFFNTSKTFTVGNGIDPNTCIVGRIQDVLYYNRSLTSQELTALFTGCNAIAITNTTTSANLNICSGATTTLSVQSDSIVNWFDSPNGVTSLGTGNTFATPVLNASATYYAEAGTVCKSARLPITVNVSSTSAPVAPQILSDTSIVYCAGIQLSLSAQSNATLRWYDAATGGNLLATGNTYQTPALVNNAGAGQTDEQFVYVESFNACANPTTSTRVAVKIKVGTASFTLNNTTPAGNYFACPGAQASLSLNTNATNIQWLLNGVVKSSGQSYTTAPLSSDSTFFARVFNATGCTTLVAFPITVYVRDNNPPINLTDVTTAVCPGDSITLKASSSTGAPLSWSLPSTVPFAVSYDSIRVSVTNIGTYTVRAGTNNVGIGGLSCLGPPTTIQLNVTPTPVGTINLSGTTISSTNLFDTYVLLRNGTQVAQSSTTGTFTFNNATCGDYQALFTNTVNSCPATINMQMRRQNVSTGCDNIIISSPSGITFPATAQARKGGGTFTAPIALNQTGNTVFNNICTVVGGTNNLEVRIVGANGCVYLFNRNTNNVTTSTTPTLQIADYLEGDLLTTCTIKSNIVTVSITAPVSTTPSANLTRCVGQTTTLTANGTGTLRWYNVPTGGTILGSGTSFTTPVITANTVFYVESFSGGCASTRTAISVSAIAAPTAAITPPSATVCLGEAVQLVASGGGNYAWNSGGGNAAQTTFVPTSTSNFTVTVTNSSGCSATASATVTVKPTSATPLSQTVCFGETTTFKGQTITQSGTYRDTLTNAEGCDSIITLNFTVRNRAERTINAGICTGQSYTFKGLQLTQAGTYLDTLQTTLGCDSFITLNLAVNNFVTGSTSAAICQGQSFTFNGQQLTQAGQYLDTLLSAGGCDSILTLTLTVNALPQPTITQSGNTLSTQVFSSYQWQLNNNNINNAITQTYTATQTGSYTVLVTDANGCSNTSSALNVTISSVNEILDFRSVIYPNPATNELMIEVSEEIDEVKVTDVAGQVIFTKSQIQNQKSEIDVSELAEATYFIHIKTTSGKTAVKSFVKR
jgi:hypothetical protein